MTLREQEALKEIEKVSDMWRERERKRESGAEEIRS